MDYYLLCLNLWNVKDENERYKNEEDNEKKMLLGMDFIWLRR